jgi:hypothetical protein
MVMGLCSLGQPRHAASDDDTPIYSVGQYPAGFGSWRARGSGFSKKRLSIRVRSVRVCKRVKEPPDIQYMPQNIAPLLTELESPCNSSESLCQMPVSSPLSMQSPSRVYRSLSNQIDMMRYHDRWKDLERP